MPRNPTLQLFSKKSTISGNPSVPNILEIPEVYQISNWEFYSKVYLKSTI